MTLKRLRADPDAEDIPVVFLTGLDGVSDQVKGLESGAADYITKPFERDVMLARVRLRLDAGMERRGMRIARKSGLVVELDEEKFGRLTETLDAREKRVARLIALGRKNREIASEIAYSLDGVKNSRGASTIKRASPATNCAAPRCGGTGNRSVQPIFDLKIRDA